MSVHFNKLTPAEAERLALLAEECGEVLHAIGKVLRHGYASRHPNGGPHNRCQLAMELGDLIAAIRLMTGASDISRDAIQGFADEKLGRVAQFLHHQGDEGSPL